VSVISLDECVMELQALDADAGLPLGPWRGLVSAHQYRQLVDAFDRYVPAAATVLDWGSGQGFFSYWLVRNGYHVTALDLHRPAMEQLIGGIAPDRFTFTDPTGPIELPFESASFDVITSVGVLEHVPDTGGDVAGSLREVARVLRPGGLFICVHFPNRRSWIEWLVRTGFPGKHAHLHRWEVGDLVQLTRPAGLEIREAMRYGAFPRNLTTRLPRRLRDSARTAVALDRLDDACGRVIGPFVQNLAFIAEKPARL